MTVNQIMHDNKHDPIAFTFGQIAKFKTVIEAATRHKFIKRLRYPLSERSISARSIVRTSAQTSRGIAEDPQTEMVTELRRTTSELTTTESARLMRMRERVMRRVNLNYFRGKKAVFKNSNVHISFEIMDEL